MASQFEKGDPVIYAKATFADRPAVIKGVHRDDPEEIYYTIGFEDGGEKQTVCKNLKEDPSRAREQQNKASRPNPSPPSPEGTLSAWNAAKINDMNRAGRNHFKAELDALGVRSGAAQELNGPITTVDKLVANPDQVLILVRSPEGQAQGFLKYGTKDLFFYDKKGKVHNFLKCICLLDFYVLDSCQRRGTSVYVVFICVQVCMYVHVCVGVLGHADLLHRVYTACAYLHTHILDMHNSFIYAAFFLTLIVIIST